MPHLCGLGLYELPVISSWSGCFNGSSMTTLTSVLDRPSVLSLTLILGLAFSNPGVVAAQEPASGLSMGINTQYMDAAVSPRSDLFQYANGRWLKDTSIPADRAMYGIDAITQEKTEAQLKVLVEQLAQRSDLKAGTNEAKIALLYRGLMDEAAIENAGLKPIAPILNEIDQLKSHRDLATLFAKLSQAGVGTPFDFGVMQDEKHADRYSIHLSQSELSLPDREYYLDKKDKRFKGFRKDFVPYAAGQLNRLGVPHPTYAAQEILSFETEIARIQWDRVLNRDPQKTYNPRSLKALKKMAPDIAWGDLLREESLPADPGAFIIAQPSYLIKLNGLIKKTPLSVWKTWLSWQVLRAYAPMLDKDLTQRQFAFESGKLRGVPEQKPRWKRALQLIEATMGEGLGQLYVDAYFPPTSKEKIQNVVNHLVAAYGESIDHLDWLGPETKQEAHKKLNKINAKLGYPNTWRDYSKLEFIEGNVPLNFARAMAFESARNNAKFGQVVDRDEWMMTPQTVNAYYNPTLNEIVFPAAQLQEPYFDEKADDAANYGNIGFIIGHELSHAFDDQGAQFDEIGNLRDWWTQEDHAAFSKKTAAIVAQYNAVEPLPKVFVNGELTLGENIADNAGLTIAWKAYQASLDGKPAPVINGMTGAQRFYVSYAQSWMGKLREADLVRLLKTDPHAPMEVRTNMAVRNQDAYHEAFGTQQGDALWLAPDQRVRLW